MANRNIGKELSSSLGLEAVHSPMTSLYGEDVHRSNYCLFSTVLTKGQSFSI